MTANENCYNMLIEKMEKLYYLIQKYQKKQDLILLSLII